MGGTELIVGKPVGLEVGGALMDCALLILRVGYETAYEREVSHCTRCQVCT